MTRCSSRSPRRTAGCRYVRGLSNLENVLYVRFSLLLRVIQGGDSSLSNVHLLLSAVIFRQRGELCPYASGLRFLVTLCLSSVAHTPHTQVSLKKGHKVIPTKYVFSHRAGVRDFYARTWTFEGSNDGEKWKVLSKHTDDESFNKTAPTAAFDVKTKVWVYLFDKHPVWQWVDTPLSRSLPHPANADWQPLAWPRQAPLIASDASDLRTQNHHTTPTGVIQLFPHPACGERELQGDVSAGGVVLRRMHVSLC